MIYQNIDKIYTGIHVKTFYGNIVETKNIKLCLYCKYDLKCALMSIAINSEWCPCWSQCDNTYITEKGKIRTCLMDLWDRFCDRKIKHCHNKKYDRIKIKKISCHNCKDFMREFDCCWDSKDWKNLFQKSNPEDKHSKKNESCLYYAFVENCDLECLRRIEI